MSAINCPAGDYRGLTPREETETLRTLLQHKERSLRKWGPVIDQLAVTAGVSIFQAEVRERLALYAEWHQTDGILEMKHIPLFIMATAVKVMAQLNLADKEVVLITAQHYQRLGLRSRKLQRILGQRPTATEVWITVTADEYQSCIDHRGLDVIQSIEQRAIGRLCTHINADLTRGSTVYLYRWLAHANWFHHKDWELPQLVLTCKYYIT